MTKTSKPIQETENNVEACGHSFLKTYLLPPQVLEDITSVYLPGYNDERANLLHQKNHSNKLKLHLHSITRTPRIL